MELIRNIFMCLSSSSIIVLLTIIFNYPSWFYFDNLTTKQYEMVLNNSLKIAIYVWVFIFGVQMYMIYK
jgi:hypothetical protein